MASLSQNSESWSSQGVTLLPAFEDNYIFVLHSVRGRDVAVVDPGDAEVVERFLKRENLKLTDIFLTHHHWDHIGGVKALCDHHNVKVWGAAADMKRLPPLDHALCDDERHLWNDEEFRVFEIPGHTLGHIMYYFPHRKILFVGDTLFNHGCGRMFEGTPTGFWHSLQKIRQFPDETMVYCAHEYTLSNLRFARSLEPSSKTLEGQWQACQKLRQEGLPTVPMPLGQQKLTNPFLRCDESLMMKHLGSESASPEEVFRAMRQKKDHFS